MSEVHWLVTAAQRQRKARSEMRLRTAGVDINPQLPFTEDVAAVRVPTAEDVAGRLLALTLVALKGEGLEAEHLADIIAERGAMAHFSPKERAFIEDPAPSEHDLIQFCWRYEAAWVMLWALQPTGRPLGLPETICDVPALVRAALDSGPPAARGLRSTSEILDECDVTYRAHWAVRQARLDGSTATGNLDGGVALERHHALNWLLGHEAADWDDVPTDT